MQMRGFLTLLNIAKLLPRLGLINIFRVARHRLLLRFGVHPVCRLKAEITPGIFFQEPAELIDLPASTAWNESLKYFDWFELPSEGVPNWFARPLSGGTDWQSSGAWWTPTGISGGDIKEIWDISRFSWVLALAQRAAKGDRAELDRLNEWLRDWSEKNSPYIGPNWACGQEASIRLMHLAVAAFILGQERVPSQSVLSFVRAHLARIELTLSYSLSQDNNHGVLEAAGLFVGGEWLCAASGDASARRWADLGRKWLEERAKRLIFPDGGFSMYSVAYHREFLDALTICEFWRLRFDLPHFSSVFAERAKGAALWLKAFTNPVSGDVPNIGGNDGTRLFPLTDTGYRDFRPSVQISCVVFAGARAYSDDGEWNLPLNWLRIPLPDSVLPEDASRLFDDCGFALLCSGAAGGAAQVYVRYPKFRFRPNHADGLHLDFWLNGQNALRDGGSFSYDIGLGLADYFMGVQSHNTVQFDYRDQMPRLGRFLFGGWPATGKTQISKTWERGVSLEVSYMDHKGANHFRGVTLGVDSLEVKDIVGGFHKSAILRWRLQPGNWLLREGSLSDGNFTLSFSADVPICRAEIVTGWESRYYLSKNEIPVLEIEIQEPGTLITYFGWTK